MAASSSSSSRPYGDTDTPGYSALPDFHHKLVVGNATSPARLHHDHHVLSTAAPTDARGEHDHRLSTTQLLFDDERGNETADKAQYAAARIVEGAAILHRLLESGERVLVHCAWGQNRSCSICCAYAVLYRGWDADDAIAYVRERNRAERKYRGQAPPNGGAMHNRVFCDIVRNLGAVRVVTS